MKQIFIIQLILIASFNEAFSQNLLYRKIQKLDNLNTTGDESQPVLTARGDSLFFIRAHYKGNTGGKYSGQDIWYSVKDSEEWQPPKNSLRKLNNADNNAVVGISSSSDQIYLLNSYSPPARRDQLVAYSSNKSTKWSRPEELDLVMKMKGKFYSLYMHPDEDVLILSADSKGSYGLEDLYVSVKSANGWSEPLNIGNKINTEGYEIAPFLSENKDSLFFSSNGHAGLGDADIFVSRRLGDNWNEWSDPVNLEAPVNSEAFDAYYFQSGNEAIFSSNRDGNSDLYKVSITIDKDETDININLAEEKAEDPAVKEDNNIVATIQKPEIHSFETDIYFSFDSDEISVGEKVKLVNIITEVTSGNKNTVTDIYIYGHTDDVGPDDYNLKLSQSRADAVQEYLVANGFSNQPVYVKPKGESFPKAPNTSKAGREKNRRVEVIVKVTADSDQK